MDAISGLSCEVHKIHSKIEVWYGSNVASLKPKKKQKNKYLVGIYTHIFSFEIFPCTSKFFHDYTMCSATDNDVTMMSIKRLSTSGVQTSIKSRMFENKRASWTTHRRPLGRPQGRACRFSLLRDRLLWRWLQEVATSTEWTASSKAKLGNPNKSNKKKKQRCIQSSPPQGIVKIELLLPKRVEKKEPWHKVRPPHPPTPYTHPPKPP